MPSPFPGMDPWLEDPDHWGNVHARLIAEVQTALNALIRPKYLARIEERVFLVPDDDPTLRSRRVADVRVERTRSRPKRGSGGTATATVVVTDPLVVRTIMEEEEVEKFVKIVEVETQDVVTVVEILSPSNKTPGAESRAQFLKKMRQVTHSPAHWVEIDLLREGQRHPWQVDLPPHEYLCHVSPEPRRPAGLVWPIRLADRLPTVGIPLKGRDLAARLDLQAVFDTGYERGAWDGTVDYRKPPVVPLPPDLDAWADALLREKGLR